MVTMCIFFCVVSSGLATLSNTPVPGLDHNEGCVEEAYVNLRGRCKENVAAAVCSEHKNTLL